MAAVINRGARAATLPIPAPVGGLNTRSSLAAMPPGDASIMSNLFPYADRVETRAGFTLLSTVAENPASTSEGFIKLMSYGAGTASDTLFAVYYNNNVTGQLIIYLVASDGTLTLKVSLGGTTIPSAIGEWTQFGSASGTNYLIVLVTYNTGAADTFIPQAYDGSTWSEPSISGVPRYTLGVHSHRNRLWFYNAPAAPLTAYYLPVGAISGTVSTFSLAPFVKRGGRIVAMRTWTRDGGEGGSDDLAVFFTNRGEAVIYSGTDPSTPATWGLVGVFDLGVPASYSPSDRGQQGIGYSTCVQDSYAMKYGSDLLFAMQSGITSANKIMQAAEGGEDYTISTKINPSVTDASNAWVALAASDSTTSNWKMCFAPALRALFISVPTAITTVDTHTKKTVTDLYVMNTETGAWTKFSGMNCRDMIAIGSTLYFTDGTNKLYKYDGTAADDNGTAITFECRQAYNYLNVPTNKLATLMQPMLRATGNFSLTVQAGADFNAGAISSYTSYSVSAAQNLQPWISPSKYGRAFATHLKGQTSAGVVSWYATNYVYKSAGIV